MFKLISSRQCSATTLIHLTKYAQLFFSSWPCATFCLNRYIKFPKHLPICLGRFQTFFANHCDCHDCDGICLTRIRWSEQYVPRNAQQQQRYSILPQLLLQRDAYMLHLHHTVLIVLSEQEAALHISNIHIFGLIVSQTLQCKLRNECPWVNYTKR